MIDKVTKQQCTGCKSCGDICGKNAISYYTDSEGFWYPSIDKSKCVECNLCEKACPILTKEKQYVGKTKEPDTYALYHNEEEIRFNSTSGGAYYAFAKTFLDEGGYIVGCTYSEDYKSAMHIISKDINGLTKVMGSKYFQSETEGIYKETKNLLDSGEKVLFCGCPCQIAALNNYLMKQCENLVTIDFVCRGINSPMVYKKFLEDLEEKYNSKVIKVHFKNKTNGWINLSTKVEFENGKVYLENRHNDAWVNGFVSGGFFMRPSCENCNFKQLPRVSDITMGDFWGLKFTKDEAKNGVSLVMINSEKGKQLFNRANKQFIVRQKSLQDALDGNPAILNPVIFPKNRDEFFEKIYTERYSDVVWKLLHSSKWKRKLKTILYKNRSI